MPTRRKTATERSAVTEPDTPVMAADRVYDAIYAAVVDHRLMPGSRLREEELAQTFAVSRTVVRQALHRLAQDGVITLRHNHGAMVPAPTRRDGEHVFDARRVVECEVARRLAGKLTVDQLAALRRLVDAEARATRSQNKEEAIRLSGQFHLQLAQMSGNPIFVRLLEGYGTAMGLYTSALGAHLTWTLPFGLLIMLAVFNRFNPAFEEAASDLGASPWQSFTHVVLPLIAPSLVGVGMFGFTLSWDEIARTSSG